MDLGLINKNALVTGGTHGIGRAIVEALAGEGCNVAFFSRDQKKVIDTAEALKKHNVKSMGMIADALDKASLDEVAAQIKREWEGVHILINNVGGGGRWGDEDILKTQDKVWDEVYQKNTGAAIFFTKACLPFMMKERFGRVITITSIFGKEAGGRPWFNISKASEIALMKNLSLKHEYAKNAITFNSIAPGNILIEDTGWDEIRLKDPKKFLRDLEKNFPMERMGTPAEVANVVAFLCSGKASLVNGACITVDGGESTAY